MVEIDTVDIDVAFQLFCRVMNIPHKKAFWKSILEFSTFLGFGVFSNPSGPPAYPDDLKRKIDALIGPHGETIIRAYKIRRTTPIGCVRTPIIKTIHAACLMFYIAREHYRDMRSVAW